MGDSFVQVLPDGSGKKIAASELVQSGETVQRQHAVIADPVDEKAKAGVVQTSALEKLKDDVYGAVSQIPMIKDIAESLKQMNRIMGRALGMASNPATGELRALVSTVAGVTTVTTVTSVTTVSQLAGQPVNQTQLAFQDRSEWALAVRSRIT